MYTTTCIMLRTTCILLLDLIARALAEMEGFIVGGHFANINNHAHSAFLNINCVKPGSANAFICGSSVVNQNILLTAAHCLHECTTQSHIQINLGNESRIKGQSLSVSSFVIHEEYVPTTSENDICLLRSERWLRLGQKISRVALLKNPPYTEQATVAGWGMVDEIRQMQSNQLKSVIQNVWQKRRCFNVFGFMPKGTICAANPDSSEYASSGDSGSALVVRGFIQIGLVSYKVPQYGRHIVVYTDVGFFYDWIRTYSIELACNSQLPIYHS